MNGKVYGSRFAFMPPAITSAVSGKRGTCSGLNRSGYFVLAGRAKIPRLPAAARPRELKTLFINANPSEITPAH